MVIINCFKILIRKFFLIKLLQLQTQTLPLLTFWYKVLYFFQCKRRHVSTCKVSWERCLFMKISSYYTYWIFFTYIVNTCSFNYMQICLHPLFKHYRQIPLLSTIQIFLAGQQGISVNCWGFNSIGSTKFTSSDHKIRSDKPLESPRGLTTERTLRKEFGSFPR